MELRTSTRRASLLAIATALAATAALVVLLPGGIITKKEARRLSGPKPSSTNELVAEIRVVGNNMIPTSQILDQLQSRVGRPFDSALVQSDVRKLTSRGWFVTVQPTYEQAENGRSIILNVVERPVVRFVEYLGNKKIRNKKLNKETGLTVGGPVDPYTVEEARRKIISLYKSNGYNNVQVTILKGNKPTDQGIVFVINEGTSKKIWKLEFEGNEFASDGQFQALFKDFVDREQIEAEVDRITAHYRSFGFFQAKVGHIPEVDEAGERMTLRFVIHEGRRFSVENLSFMGNKVFASESLAMGIDLPSGQPFDQAKMKRDANWLKELYGSQGYVFADIQAVPVFLEETDKLNLLYKIKEGKRWRIGNIVIHINGDNPPAKVQTALNRLSMRSGEIADSREIMASERRLQACGLFKVDPTRGVTPKITLHIPELDEERLASQAPGYRGQSPNATDQLLFQYSNTVPTSADVSRGDDLVTVHVYLDSVILAGEGKADAGGFMPDLDPCVQYGKMKSAVGLGPNEQFARAAYTEGMRLFTEKEYNAAAEQFKAAIARGPHSPVEQDARFMLGLSYYQNDRYIKARDAFDELVKEHPNTRYMDALIDREWKIARFWENKARTKYDWPMPPNAHEKERLGFDTMDDAIKTYDKIRLNDPTGPRADDAIMATANIYFKCNRFKDADNHYTLLRKEYPQSELQFEAHLLGLQAKLRTYQSEDHDNTLLEEAKTLVKQLRVQFANQLPAEKKEWLRTVEGQLNLELARRDYRMAEYYDGATHYGAARHYYTKVINGYPDSEIAAKARECLAKIQGDTDEPTKPLGAIVGAVNTRVARIPELPVASEMAWREDKTPRAQLWIWSAAVFVAIGISSVVSFVWIFPDVSPDASETGLSVSPPFRRGLFRRT